MGKENQENEIKERLRLMSEVFTMARRDAVTNHPTDRNIISALLNFQVEIENILKNSENK